MLASERRGWVGIKRLFRPVGASGVYAVNVAKETQSSSRRMGGRIGLETELRGITGSGLLGSDEARSTLGASLIRDCERSKVGKVQAR